MAKPSIFSSDYDKSMRRRKRMIRSLIIVVVIVSLIGIRAMVGNVNSKDGNGKIFGFLKTEDNANNGQQSSNSKKISTDNDEGEKNNLIKENTTNDEAVKEQEEKVIEELSKQESLEIVLPSGEKAIAFININDGVKTFHKVDLDDGLYNINPSKDTVVILDTNTQSLILSDINGKLKDITKKSHTSTKGTNYTKENRLKKYPDLVWNDHPKFVNDDEIAYVSQLPYLSIKPNKFLWKYSISNDTHNIVKGKYSGKKIEIGNLSEEGLEVIIDGNKKVIK